VNEGIRAGLGANRLFQAILVFTALTAGVSALARKLSNHVTHSTHCAGNAIASMSADGRCADGLPSVPSEAMPAVIAVEAGE
jgi:hypothetical protein